MWKRETRTWTWHLGPNSRSFQKQYLYVLETEILWQLMRKWKPTRRRLAPYKHFCKSLNSNFLFPCLKISCKINCTNKPLKRLFFTMCHSVSFDASLNTKVKWNVAKGKVREMKMKKWREVLWKCKKKKRKHFSFDVAAMKKHRKCFSSFSFCHDRDFFSSDSVSVLELQEIYLDIRWEREIGTHWKSSWKFKWKTLKIFYAEGWKKKRQGK